MIILYIIHSLSLLNTHIHTHMWVFNFRQSLSFFVAPTAYPSLGLVGGGSPQQTGVPCKTERRNRLSVSSIGPACLHR